jgi:hypothetical protein
MPALIFFVSNTEHEAHPADIVATVDGTGFHLPTGGVITIGGQNIQNSAIAMAAAMAIALG